MVYAEEMMEKVKAVADYPILIMTDAEGGIADHMVGKHNAIGTTGSEKHAYAFGKVVGVTARKKTQYERMDINEKKIFGRLSLSCYADRYDSRNNLIDN